MKRPWFLAVLVLLGTFLAGFVSLIAATNVLLSTSWLRKQINASPEKTFIDYARASSRWPGRVHLRGFSIRSRDRNVEWLATLEEARIEVDLPALRKKRFHVRTLTGSGLSFRLRERLEPKEAESAATRARAKDDPPIQGFSDPPLTGPPEPVDSAAELEKLWRVHIGRLSVAPVKEIWVDDFHYQGGGTLNGGFFLWPKHVGEVYPSTLTLDAGRLDLGKREVAVPFHGTVTCRLPHFEVAEYPGNEIWKIMTGEAMLTGETHDLAFLGTVVGGPGAPRFEKGSGPLALKLDLKDGSGSAAVEFDLKRAEVHLEKVRLGGSVRGALLLRALDFRRGTADLSGTFLDLKDVLAEGAGGSRAWWGRFDAAPARFDMNRSNLSSHLAARCRDARPLFALFDVDLPGWARGLLTLEGLKAQADVHLAHEALNLGALHAAGGAFKIDGRYRKKGPSKNGAFLVQTSALDLGVKVDDAGIGLKLVGAKKWFEESGGRIGNADPSAPRNAAVVLSRPAPAAQTRGIRSAPTSRSDRTRSSSPAGSRGDSSPRERAPESRIRG